MACGCGGRSATGYQSNDYEEAFQHLDGLGCREIVRAALELRESMVRPVTQMEKAERAKRLAMGKDIVRLYTRAAETDRASAIRQFRGVIARVEERINREDWSELVQRVDREFVAKDRRALIDEGKARFRLAALDMDGVSADDAEAAVRIVDDALDGMTGGIDQAIGKLRTQLERGLAAMESPGLGRQLASPITEQQTICIGIASAAATLMGIACAVSYGCWCCAWFVIMAFLAAAILICLLA